MNKSNVTLIPNINTSLVRHKNKLNILTDKFKYYFIKNFGLNRYIYLKYKNDIKLIK